MHPSQMDTTRSVSPRVLDRIISESPDGGLVESLEAADSISPFQPISPTSLPPNIEDDNESKLQHIVEDGLAGRKSSRVSSNEEDLEGLGRRTQDDPDLPISDSRRSSAAVVMALLDSHDYHDEFQLSKHSGRNSPGDSEADVLITANSPGGATSRADVSQRPTDVDPSIEPTRQQDESTSSSEGVHGRPRGRERDRQTQSERGAEWDARQGHGGARDPHLAFGSPDAAATHRSLCGPTATSALVHSLSSDEDTQLTPPTLPSHLHSHTHPDASQMSVYDRDEETRAATAPGAAPSILPSAPTLGAPTAPEAVHISHPAPSVLTSPPTSVPTAAVPSLLTSSTHTPPSPSAQRSQSASTPDEDPGPTADVVGNTHGTAVKAGAGVDLVVATPTLKAAEDPDLDGSHVLSPPPPSHSFSLAKSPSPVPVTPKPPSHAVHAPSVSLPPPATSLGPQLPKGRLSTSNARHSDVGPSRTHGGTEDSGSGVGGGGGG
eukprot:Rmarinus@m.16434